MSSVLVSGVPGGGFHFYCIMHRESYKQTVLILILQHLNWVCTVCIILQKRYLVQIRVTVKILKIGTPEIITIIVLQLEQLDFTVQYCVQKMQTEQQTEKTLIRLLHKEQSDLGLHCLLRPICPNI